MKKDVGGLVVGTAHCRLFFAGLLVHVELQLGDTGFQANSFGYLVLILDFELSYGTVEGDYL